MKIHDLTETSPDIDKKRIKQLILEYFNLSMPLCDIGDDGVVNVIERHHVRLIKQSRILPFQFGKIIGDFNCCNNKLTTLRGAPSHVTGDFDCLSNELTSLEGGPTIVSGNYSCSRNKLLKNLIGAPQKIYGEFSSNGCGLTSLEGGPVVVEDNYSCNRNSLTTLHGAPALVGGDFSCTGNALISLKGFPKEVHGSTILPFNPELPLLQLFLSDIVINVVFKDDKVKVHTDVSDIINKYLPKGRAGIMPCAANLIKAGYKGNARL